MNFRAFFSVVAFLGTTISHASLEANQIDDIDELKVSSQVSQDQFVYSVLYGLLGKQDKGYYLEIGAGEPISINNSYFFEKELQWDGVSIDISDGLAERWYAARNNLLLSEDATQSDYSDILKTFPQVIDYLSLDVDGHYDVVLEKLVSSDHIFKIITIEHDFYRYGDLYRKREREILTGLGYHLLCSDVSNSGLAFEDWWIHPDFFPSDLFQQLKSLNLQGKDSMEIVQNIKTLISN